MKLWVSTVRIVQSARLAKRRPLRVAVVAMATAGALILSAAPAHAAVVAPLSALNCTGSGPEQVLTQSRAAGYTGPSGSGITAYVWHVGMVDGNVFGHKLWYSNVYMDRAWIVNNGFGVYTKRISTGSKVQVNDGGTIGSASRSCVRW